MTKVLLLNDNSEHLNWGAQATPYALKRMLQDTIPDVEIDPFTYSWLARQFRQLTITPHKLYERDKLPRLLRRYSKHVEFFPVITDDFEHFADKWTAGEGGPMASEFVAAAKRSDAIVFNGEHMMYRSSMEGCRGLFLIWLARTRLGKVSCLVNHSAHLTNTRPIMPGMVKFVYPYLDLITVRESRSWHHLQELGIQNAKLVPDVVFYLDESEYDEPAVKAWKERNILHGQDYFCLSGSALPMSAPSDGWTGTVVDLVQRLKCLGLQAVLMAKDDHCQFLKEVARETGSAFFGPEHTFHEVWPLLRGAMFLVTGHYHYVIMSAMVGTPFIPLSTNTHKMQGVCEHLGWRTVMPFDATFLKAETDSICEEAETLLRNYRPLSEHLRARSAQLKVEAVKHALLVHQVMTNSTHGAEKVEV